MPDGGAMRMFQLCAGLPEKIRESGKISPTVCRALVYAGRSSANIGILFFVIVTAKMTTPSQEDNFLHINSDCPNMIEIITGN